METTVENKFIPIYSLDAMDEPQRQEYVRNVCNHLGIPPELNLVNLGYLDEEDGPRRLVVYIKRGGTEMIRSNRGISTGIVDFKEINGSFVVSVVGTDALGRKESALGSKWIKNLTGVDLDDAIMTAQTRAHRRCTLQFVGAGVLDESEVNKREAVETTNTTPIAIAPQPTVVPNTAPGSEVKIVTLGEHFGKIDPNAGTGSLNGPVTNTQKLAEPKWMNPLLPHSEQQRVFAEEQEKMRAEAIASLNKAATSAVESVQQQEQPKPVKKRTPRKKSVDLGPSEPVPNVAAVGSVLMETRVETIEKPAAVIPVPVLTAPTVVTTAPAAPVAVPIQPPAATKSIVPPDVLAGFRSRQYKFKEELEQNGFGPDPGLSVLDKLRNFAALLFPGVTNFNHLTADQWEQYLSKIEAYLKINGPKPTIVYIEESIGIER